MPSAYSLPPAARDVLAAAAAAAITPAPHPPGSASDRRPILRVLCAWCGQEIASAPAPEGTAPASHGICAPCAHRHFGVDLQTEIPDE